MKVYKYKHKISEYNVFEMVVISKNIESAKPYVIIELDRHNWGKIEDGEFEEITMSEKTLLVSGNWD